MFGIGEKNNTGRRKHLSWGVVTFQRWRINQEEMQNKDGWEKRFLYSFPFSLAVEEMRGRPRRKATLLSAANIWLPSPSVFPACSRPISSERSGLWQGGLVTAARSCNTAGAFHISAVNKGNRSRSFSISTAHDLPTCWQRLKGKRRELRPALSWSCTAGWPVTSYSNSQPEKGRKGWRPPEDVCVCNVSD